MDNFDLMLTTPHRPIIIAGPCLVESRDMLLQVAEHLGRVCRDLPVDLVLKGSYRKANRTSAGSFQGIGDEKALSYLREAGAMIGARVLTDIHADHEAAFAAEYVDVLQIPAFLSRQTSLLEAAAVTGKIVNIKKAQFMAPQDMAAVLRKAQAAANDAGLNDPQITLCERGSSFGYNNLVVDMRALVIMRDRGAPVVFDATHSVQLPGGGGDRSLGQRQYVAPLARAAMAVGVDGLFMETHPDPDSALSDGPNAVPLHLMERLLEQFR
jgi:2-dehydro-3-deoxyphosphooctonate aldolase (KDO 8-P synthase)